MKMIKRISIIFVFFCIAIACGTVFACAATDPAITIVSPAEGEPIATDNLLISVKVTQPGKILTIAAFELQQKVGDKWLKVKSEELEAYDKKADADKKLVSVMSAEIFESKGSVSVYTRKLENIKPGVYLIKVESVDLTGKITYTKDARVSIIEKVETDGKPLFESSKSGASQFLQGILSKIFK